MKKIIFTILLLFIYIFPTANMVFADTETDNTVSFPEVVSLVDDNQIDTASAWKNNIIFRLKDKSVKVSENTEDISDFLKSNNITITENIEEKKPGFFSKFKNVFLNYIFVILLMIATFFILKIVLTTISKRRFKKFIKSELPNFDNFIKEQLRQENEMEGDFGRQIPMPPFPGVNSSYGYQRQANQKQESKDSKPKVTLKDVEGLDELKEDIYRIIDYLKNPKKYTDMGARAPKGVILYGPPGTGKTLIAKAIAGEANVSFLSAVGSDFCEKYVGVGAQRVRALYKRARSQAPCIVFIDEVDAVAGRRDGEGNNEDERTTNALLAELDGFNGSDGVITICATNRLDLLDSAFQRAGRFDLKLAVSLPDADGREKILKLHAKNKKLARNISFKDLATKTIGFSGADLESLLNESALLAASKNKKEITEEEINDAFFKVVMKGNKKRSKDAEKTKKLIAYHEAGHTLATKLLTDDAVPSVTIIGSTSGAGGVTFRTPKEITLHSKKYLENLIKVMYAGRAAEEIFLGTKEDITTGASQDIKQATNIIREYISSYGMSDVGMLDLSQFTRDYESVLEEAKTLSKQFYGDVLSLLTENIDTLENLANALFAKETLNEKEIDSIVKDLSLEKI